MAESLVGLACAWFGTPAARDLTETERLVLVIIAERAHKTTRTFWVHRGDRHEDGTPMTPSETIALRAGLTADGLTKVLRRLAKRGLEVRIPRGTRKDGTPIFAVRGRATDYRLPELPASVRLPARPSGQSRPPPPGENPPGRPPRGRK
ncbi:hypothetical protein ABZ470_39920 [Streptosporangium sp. NPDC020072]|uniref:hypothetical protein n=1 Tax=Streptosporangium sp. NPDC020072 TaxID=3154788 RepID=UPI003434DCFC